MSATARGGLALVGCGLLPLSGYAQALVSPADDGGGAHVLYTPEIYSRLPAPRAVSPNTLTYHGGPVMRNVRNYVIIWNPPGSTFSATYQKLIEQYFTDCGGTPFMTIDSQYGDNTGTPVPNTCSFGGTWVDTVNAYPHAGTFADPVTRQNIQDEVDRAIAANPTWQAPGLSTMYFVYLGHNIIECMGAGNCFAGPGVPSANAKYCAYHSYFGSGPRIFATMPYASDGSCYGSSTTYPNIVNHPNGLDQDLVLSPTSHEQFEAYSDPLINAWYSDTSTPPGNENGDNCAYQYGQVEPDGANYVLNGHRYQLQLEWSNFLPGGCIKRLGPASQPTVTGDLNFGTVPRGTMASREILIQNTAAGDLNLLNVRLADGSPAEFSIDPSAPLWGTLPLADSFLIKVNFSPGASAASSGPLTTSLVIDTDEPGFETQSVPASASIGLPKAVLTPASLDFGIVCPGSFVDRLLTVNNLGEAPLTIFTVAIAAGSSPGLSVTGPGLPLTLAAGAQISFTVRFAPTGPFGGPIGGNVVVTTDDPVNPSESVPINGAVGAPGRILVTGSTAFGDICAGTAAEKTIRICNGGYCDLSVTNVAFVGGCLDFAIVNNPFPAIISRGSCLDLLVRLTPTSCGPKSCTLMITTGDPISPTITLTVTANTPCPDIDVPLDLGFAPEVVQTIGACTEPLPFPISNKGQCNLTVTAITISGVNASDFRLSGLPSFPIILEPGHIAGEGDLNVVFAPTKVDRNRQGTITVTYVSDPITGATTSVTRLLCGEGVNTGARVLVTASGIPLAKVESIHLQRINANRNKGFLDTQDNARNLPLVTVVPAAPCEPFQYHREYGTVSNPIQLLPGSYQVTVMAVIKGKHKSKTVGFNVDTCDFNANIVVGF